MQSRWFLNDFYKTIDKSSIWNIAKRKPTMTNSVVMTIMILFHLSDFVITTANVDDRQAFKNGAILKSIWGKLFGDKIIST